MKKRLLPTNDRQQFRLSKNTSPFLKRLSLFTFLCCFLLMNLPGYAQPPAGYTLFWADEFNTTSLDTTNWKYRIDGSGTSYQVKENVKLDSGKLQIKLKKESYNGKSFTGGGIITKQPRRYGYYEVSVKLAGNYGWHEAFWTSYLSGFDDPNQAAANLMPGRLEIDCFEHYGEYASNYFTYGTIEWAPIHGNVNRDYKTVTQDLGNSYNSFGFEYTPDFLNYFFNGTLLKTVDTRDLPSHDIFLWLTAIATRADADSSGNVYFDYLRCYEIPANAYATRKISFINYLDSLRGTTRSAGRDLWIEAEDFLQPNNWIAERESGIKVLRGLTSTVPGCDSLELKAATGIVVDSAATYTLWVRARDYSATPGLRKFKVLVNGAASSELFGDHGANGYEWENGGRFYLPAGANKIEILDHSQYFARCDRLLLTSDTNFIPQGLGGTRNAKHELTGIGVYPFQPGNLVVVRIGDGSAPLTIGNAHKVFLDEYTKSGMLVRSRPMPVFILGKNKRFTLSVSSTDQTEGYCGLSPDGQFLALGGYDAAPGYASVVAAPYSAVKRVVSIVNAQGVINTSTVLNSFSATSIRSAVTNGYDIWAAGGNNGIRYTKLGDTNSLALVSQSGRSLKIFNEQLYASTTFSGFRIATVGAGLPKTTGQTMTNLPGIVTTSGSPYDLFLADLDNLVAGPDVLYVADEGNNGLSKYSLVGSNWVFNGKIGSSTDQYRGLTGKKTDCGVVLFATRKNSGSTAGGGEIVSIIDAGGYNAAFSGTPVVLATAAPNTLIRGIALSPGSQEK
jgi:beta-glucanase (GH16 family)